METLSSNYQENVTWFNETLGVGRSCDIVSRDYVIGGRRARIWVIDGFGMDGWEPSGCGCSRRRWRT